MSKVHIGRQGFITKSAIPNVTRVGFTQPTALILGSGSNGSTNITDTSVNSWTVNRFGNTQISTAQFPTGMSSSILFDGIGDYLNISGNTSFALGTNNFTIEFWVYFLSVASAKHIVVGYDNSTTLSYAFYTGSTGNLTYFLSSTGNTWNIANNVAISAISVNTWYHVALVRNGNVFTPYFNGVAGTTTTNSSAIFGSAPPINIGNWPGDLNTGLNGYISNFRFTNNLALYTSNFTPPALPLSATSQIYPSSLLFLASGANGSTTFTDSSIYNQNLTSVSGAVISTAQFPTGMSSSLFCNGTSYLSGAYNSQYSLTGNFTLEIYINFSAHGAYGGLLCNMQASGSPPAGWQIIFNDTTNAIMFQYTISGVVTNLITTGSINPNTWNHVCVVRNGTGSNNVTIYLNGVASATATSVGTINSTNAPLLIGIEITLALRITGYFSNARIVNGVALYTSNFTPPALPLSSNVPAQSTLSNNIYGVYKRL